MGRTLTLSLLLIAGLVLAQAAPVLAQDSTRWITHVVQPDENLFRIALQYNLTVDVVMAANGIQDPDHIVAGQTLRIPLGGADSPGTDAISAAPPAATTVLGGTVMHTVAAGETPTLIAAQYGVTVPALLAANNLDLAAALSAGQTLVIPLASPADLGLIGVGNSAASAAASPAVPEALAAVQAAPPADDAAESTAYVEDLGILPADGSAAVAVPGAVLGAAHWIDAGVIVLGSGNLRSVYLRGLTQGNNPHAFTTIGDCNSEAPFFLAKFDRGEYDLGAYGYLQPVLDHFAGSYDHDSIATWTGNHVWALFDTTWSNPAICAPGETPLECEFRLHKPSIALIRLGTNEAHHPQMFEQDLRRVLEFALERGTIPVLGTKADRREGSDQINAIIRALAAEYRVPLWDFSKAAETIPARGLMPDGFHLTYFPPNFSEPLALQSGHGMQNLTALIMLDTIWRHAMY